MSGREIPPFGPDDDSVDSILEKLVIEDIRRPADFLSDTGLDDILLPLTDEELAEGHPASELVSTILEMIQYHMTYFQVADADKITIDQIQSLDQQLYFNTLELEDLVLIVKDELNQQDKDKPVPTILTFDHIIEASSRIDMPKRLNEETVKAITMLAIKIFGQNKEELLFRKAIESPTLARKIRRFAWVLSRPFMEDFPNTIEREIAIRKYERRMQNDSSPVKLNFPELVEIADRNLRGIKVEVDNALLNINPNDHAEILRNRMLSIDVIRAIAVNETVALTDI